MKHVLIMTTLLVSAATGTAQAQAPIDWKAVEAETLQHFQALVRIDTSNPPGNETRAVDYLQQVFDKEAVPYQVFAGDANRANLVVRIKGNGTKKPILVMGHTDVVTIDPKKWIDHGPFSADLAGGHVYGRGTVDDKDNLVASLMLVLMLKRSNAALDRDVIFLAESGEEGSPEVGAQFMIDKHFDAIDAEYCLAEGGGPGRVAGKYTRANISTTEKEPRAVEMIARGPAGHGSQKHYNVDVLPTMSTGASDKAQIRSKGVQCYGIGPALDYEDGAKGFGAHSDQERILEAELHRFVRFQYDVVMDVARAR
jgi:acetylornithine deacetylase/succinyl-diaminopimelate desuccinylase-like protein